MLEYISINTPKGESLTDITPHIREIVHVSGLANGLCALVVPHTTAAITINSALDAATPRDIIAEIDRLVPKRVDFLHQYDTPADAAGHIKAALIGHSLLLVIADNDVLIGSSQSVLFYEFDGPRTRKVQVKLISG